MSGPEPFDCAMCGRPVRPRRYRKGSHTMGRRRQIYCDRCNWLTTDNAGAKLDGAVAELERMIG